MRTFDERYCPDGRWRQTDDRGRCLWPRTYHDDHGVTHAVLLSFDDGYERPVMACTGHTAHKTGVDEHNQPLTCLTCLVRAPNVKYLEEEDDDDA